ncbi:hypothetical protein [Neorhizobium petrolearium]|uniref:Uncharacterized protein n=1 Tax=Neorhizobium petrolearium TaxID=515361 RepID=A0ABY8M255_9HYPH|nr:hypothetical protein [Neorhizobium petrolearium]MCC2608356.1 hypothetical protein [Neorhizobium petrolearium]WGI68635.1 hypothetical protein QEO92_00610 [Neorhizobium petrolearium]
MDFDEGLPRKLAALLEGDFAEGYAQFKEIVDFSESLEGLSASDKAVIYLYQLVSTAMIEGLNRGEERFEIDPTEMLVCLWAATGTALALVNIQAFKTEGMGMVKKQTRTTVMDNYQAFVKHAIDEERRAK